MLAAKLSYSLLPQDPGILSFCLAYLFPLCLWFFLSPGMSQWMPYLSPADKPALLPGSPAAPLLSPHSSQQGLLPPPPLVFGAIHAYVRTGAGSRAAVDQGAV